MFKLFIAVATGLSLMFGATATIESQPGEPLYNVKMWSVQTWNRLEQQTRAGNENGLPTEEPIQQQVQDQFRDQTQDQFRDQTQDQFRDQTQDRIRIHQTATVDPLHLNPNNPWTSETPIPNSGYGPGPGTCDTNRTPASGSGPNGNGNNRP